MKAALSAELRKLLTVRSTYIATGLLLVFVIFMTFYVEGLRVSDGWQDREKFQQLVLNISGAVAQIGMVVTALLMIHEYRYNTIGYTLTAANSRLKVLLAKMLTTLLYAVIVTIAAIIIGILSFRLGLAMSGQSLVTQDFPLLSVLSKSVYYTSAYMLFGLMVATLVRNVAFTIIFMFMSPATLEPLIGLLLKEDGVYLPFTLLSKVLSPPTEDFVLVRGNVSPGTAIIIFSFYLVVGWLVTSWLFRRRDAN